MTIKELKILLKPFDDTDEVEIQTLDDVIREAQSVYIWNYPGEEELVAVITVGRMK